VLHEPTQAVDVGARADIIEAIREAAPEGCGVPAVAARCAWPCLAAGPRPGRAVRLGTLTAPSDSSVSGVTPVAPGER
jgi:hypothetical protein